ncbi:MAG: c-type cytochrome [Betaproteobacteria bacterium]|nr:c-type cytochrome [Betaproteobacteria bacterium]
MKKVVVAIAGCAAVAAGSINLSMAADAKAAEGLLKKNNCIACHQVDKKVVGPAYKDVAKKYKGQKDAVALLSKKVKAGGQGVWGKVPMPPNPQVNDAELKQMVEYILAL